ncbi:MAG: hypothetical protein Q9191_003053 [Dirinaria sp. TL-2023a]
MASDQAFDADAHHRVHPRSRSRHSDRDNQPAHDSIGAGNGATERYKGSDSEETPLLSRSIEEDFAHRSSSDDGEPHSEEAEWSGAKDFEGRPWWDTPSMYWLLPPFFLFTLSFGGIIVPKLNLVLELICRDYLADTARKDPGFHFEPVVFGVDNQQCRQIVEVQRGVTSFTLWQGIIAGVLSAITSPILGRLSDLYGRKKILAFAGVGYLIAESLTIFVAKNPEMASVNWILVGYVFDGLCGSFTAAMAIVFAYASDCTAPARRSVVFGYFHGCLFSGIALGPLAAGYIVKLTGNLLIPFYVALACHTFFFLFIGFIIPESLSKKRQQQAREKLDATIAAQYPSKNWTSTIWVLFKDTNAFVSLSVLWPTGKGTTRALRRNLVLLAAIDTTMFGVAMSSMSIILIYAEYTFDWDTFMASVYQSIASTCRVTSLLVFLPIVVRILRGPKSEQDHNKSDFDQVDLYIIRAAVAFDMLGYIGYTTVRMGPLFIFSGALASIGSIGSPTLSSAMTKHVPRDRTGQLLGAVGLLHALARVVAPTIFNTIYFLTVGKFTQTVFPHAHWNEPTAPASVSDNREENDAILEPRS